MASGRMAPSNAKSGRNVDPTLRPDSRLAFRRQVRQTHGTHGTQGIIFADDLYLTFLGKTSKFGRSSMVKGWFGGKWLPPYTDSVLLCAVLYCTMKW